MLIMSSNAHPPATPAMRAEDGKHAANNYKHIENIPGLASSETSLRGKEVEQESKHVGPTLLHTVAVRVE